jgi:hypothetical protein
MWVANQHPIGVIFLMLLLSESVLNAKRDDDPPRPEPHGVLANYFQAPISFEPNQGQTEDRVKFMARGAGYNLFLMQSSVVFFLRHDEESNDLVPKESGNLAMKVVGASMTQKITGESELQGKSSYFLGSDPKMWHTNIPSFEKVRYENIYPGIDLVYHGIGGQLEYDFVVHPGAQPKAIRLEFTGAKHVRLNPRGELEVDGRSGKLCFHKPVGYQPDGERKRNVDVHYILKCRHRVGFALGAYDLKVPVVIDPVVSDSKVDARVEFRGNPAAPDSKSTSTQLSFKGNI